MMRAKIPLSSNAIEHMRMGYPMIERLATSHLISAMSYNSSSKTYNNGAEIKTSVNNNFLIISMRPKWIHGQSHH